jgi:hypothetical protein
MIHDSQDFKNGRTAGLVLAIAELLRAGYSSMAESIKSSAGIDPDEDLSFCADYDLQAFREEWPEFSDVYGDDTEIENFWKRDDKRTVITTLLVSDHEFNGPITPERVAKWSDEECQAVEDYCRAVHIHASDNDDYPVPPKPAVLEAA